MPNPQGLRSALHFEGGTNSRKGCDEGPVSSRSTQFPAWRVVPKLLALVAQKISQGKSRHQSERRNFPHEIVPCRSPPPPAAVIAGCYSAQASCINQKRRRRPGAGSCGRLSSRKVALTGRRLAVRKMPRGRPQGFPFISIPINSSAISESTANVSASSVLVMMP